ncbi:MAG: hypothetical protein NDF56_01095 [archaeon GB-1845-036]|nr:hypothetical protein [Candidatus Culexmicrobium thermophilum]
MDHLAALGLSIARISKYASHLPALLRIIDFDLAKATREDVEKVVAWINSQPYREWTKHDKKLMLRKLIQYANTVAAIKTHLYPKKSAGLSSASHSSRTSRSNSMIVSCVTILGSFSIPRKPRGLFDGGALLTFMATSSLLVSIVTPRITFLAI